MQKGYVLLILCFWYYNSTLYKVCAGQVEENSLFCIPQPVWHTPSMYCTPSACTSGVPQPILHTFSPYCTHSACIAHTFYRVNRQLRHLQVRRSFTALSRSWLTGSCFSLIEKRTNYKLQL